MCRELVTFLGIELWSSGLTASYTLNHLTSSQPDFRQRCPKYTPLKTENTPFSTNGPGKIGYLRVQE